MPETFKESGPNIRKGLNPALRWLWDLLSFYSQEEIRVPTDYLGQVVEIKKVLKSDTSGLVNSILDFAINCATVDFTVETDNPNYTSLIEQWFGLVNKKLIGRVPIGLKELSKEYYRERWKNSSLLVLRTVWEDVTIDGVNLNLPTKMWFVDGQNIAVEDGDVENRIIGSENYYIRIADKKRKLIPATKDEFIFIQKPFSTWSDLYPTPFMIQRGLYKNMKIYDMINTKGERIIGKALEYMMLFKKGSENLAQQGATDFIYSQEDLKAIKDDFKQWQADNKASPGTPSYFTNFDTSIEHLIPDYAKAINTAMYAQLDKRLLQGLGLVEVIEGSASTRREAILNPKPFISEVERGIGDFIGLISNVLELVKMRNEASHPKIFGNKTQLHYVPIKSFMNDNIRDHLRSMYDRGILSKQTYGEVVGEIDIDIEENRHKEEKEKKFTDTFAPPPITFQPPTPKVVKAPVAVKAPTDNIPVSKKGPEAKNFKGEVEEVEGELEVSEIVKQKDGYHVISKEGKNLGGPYKTKKEAVKRLRQVEYFKHAGNTEEELANLEEPKEDEFNE
jgi:hypothetical protein